MVRRYTFVKSAAKLQKKTDMSKSFIEKELRFNLEDFRDLQKRLFPKWFLDTNLWDMYNLDGLISYSSFDSLCISVDKYRKVFFRRIDYPMLGKLEIQVVFYNDSPNR